MQPPSQMIESPPPIPLCGSSDRCVPQNRCHLGVIDCTSGELVCRDTGMLARDQRGCGPLAYWPFDGDGKDLAASRDLTLKGEPGFATGLFDRALDLHHDGSQYATREQEGQPLNDEVFDLVGTDFTVQAWLYFYDLGNEQTFIEKFAGATGPAWTFTKLPANQLHVYLQPTAQIVAPPIEFPLQVFHQILMRHEQGKGTDIYYDGQLLHQGGTGEPSRTSMPLLIGKRNTQDGRDFSFNGRIDEVAIWLRALSAEEIAFLHNGGAGRKASEVN